MAQLLGSVAFLRKYRDDRVLCRLLHEHMGMESLVCVCLRVHGVCEPVRAGTTTTQRKHPAPSMRAGMAL